ncbi:MAG: hypothetical protein RR696_03185 [Clostridia bacterium]
MPGILILYVHEDFIGIVSTIRQHHAIRQSNMGEYVIELESMFRFSESAFMLRAVKIDASTPSSRRLHNLL